MITRKGYVHKEEQNIAFGGPPRSWKDVEADESTLDKKTLLPHEMPAKDGRIVVWEQRGAIVQRGAPPDFGFVQTLSCQDCEQTDSLMKAEAKFRAGIKI